MQMKFNHIVEAIAYTQQTHDEEPLQEYVQEHMTQIAQLVKGIDQSFTNDDLYFFLSFMKPWMEMRISMLEPHESELVNMLSSTVRMIGVKIPIDMLGGGMDETPSNGPLN